METTTALERTKITAEDFLNGAQTIPTHNAYGCSLNKHWIEPTTFLEWAQRGFEDADQYGLANAITYAKRAACCRVDRLIHNYHLQRLHRAPFLAKIEALEGVGIDIPSVIQELIISPRNELEHDYVPPDPDMARRALDIAKLFLTATESLGSLGTIIVLNMNLQYHCGSKDGKERVTINGWSDRSMLFMDVFSEPHSAKIIDGRKGEVFYTKLDDFSHRQAVQLASILYSENQNYSGTSMFFFTEIQRLAGI